MATTKINLNGVHQLNLPDGCTAEIANGVVTITFPTPRLVDDADVAIISPVEGDVLTYNESLDLWIAEPSPGVAASALAADTDVSIADPQEGDLLRYNASLARWINVATSYTHIQSTPGTTWTIVHNLGVAFFRLQCSFSDFTSFDGILCDLGDVDEATDAYTYVLHLGSSLSGTAIVSRI